MVFKEWLDGVHLSVHYLRVHLNEYTYRFNRRRKKKGILGIY